MDDITQKPWRIFECGDEWRVDIGTSQHEMLLISVGRRHARRIVACVNACDGFPTDVLENGRVAVVHKTSIENGGLERHVHRHPAEEQRDELLEACRRALLALENAGDVPAATEALSAALAAVPPYRLNKSNFRN